MLLSEIIGDGELVLPGVFNRAVVEDYKVSGWKVVDMLGMRTKMVRADVESKRDRYKVIVQVSGCIPGQPITEEHEATIRCSCPAFRFFFYAADRRMKVLFGGRMTKYKRVDDAVRQRPGYPKNPNYIPGACKHVILMVKLMKREGLMV